LNFPFLIVIVIVVVGADDVRLYCGCKADIFWCGFQQLDVKNIKKVFIVWDLNFVIKSVFPGNDLIRSKLFKVEFLVWLVCLDVFL